ncbi:MAG: hypothetical protein KY476_24680 [Planctomycetes bacterium]|nr:hypothetical protein [Planctomycetota bacterium]
MKRIVLILLSVVSIAVVLSQLAALGWLWSRGRLNAETIRDVAAVISADDAAVPPEDAMSESMRPSHEEIVDQRVVRLFDLEARQSELDVLKSLVEERRDALRAQAALFDSQQQEFQRRLDELRTAATGEAAERGREVLAGLSAGDAVGYLMQLDLEQNLLLLRDMPARTVAKILKEFAAAEGDDAVRQRGGELFKALSQGRPETELVDETAGNVSM